ncbi:creatininase family protein [Actinoallomurus iriomotensis]|uniref:Creatinine amidohydrolase n=1 Tax=Actinoallomurus iriomotensis TaxID=478107 RepID=A0A9W6VKJ3_9ACTN|nr:creatininase family protein [Actinoallomurus iriomotensis]GLY71750.1 creatinine amidohydrolase [Actinoallomurus iriomotensis]
MNAATRWAETDRERLAALAGEALVVLPIGSTEQHGPHLPTGTDALLAATVAERAADQAAETSPRPIVLAPPLPYGCSDHHLPFGGTLSVSTQTLTAVLTEVIRSAVAGGVRRLVIVNGHGGNTGVCHAAASTAAAHHPIAVAHVDYWRLVEPRDAATAQVSDIGPPVPGHAGAFETALVMAVRPDLVRPAPQRDSPPAPPAPPGLELHDATAWSSIDGYTDLPHRATSADGHARLDAVITALAERLVLLARTL